MNDSVKELIEQGLAVMRVENESQMQMAVQKPRDLAKVLHNATSELNAIPEFASHAFYLIPFQDSEGGTVEVTGLSIGAAMALARWWGNCANGGRIIQDLGNEYLVEGVFLDYENNLRTLRQVRVSKSYWSKAKSAVIPLREDRLTTALQAGISKAVRNAILASLPESVKERYFAEAKKIAQSDRTTTKKKATPIKQRLDKMFAAFGEFNVTPKMLITYLKHSKADEITEDELGNLIGLYNAIRDGQIDVGVVFAVPEVKVVSQGTGEAVVDELLSGSKPEKGGALVPEGFGVQETQDIADLIVNMKSRVDSTSVLRVITKCHEEGRITEAQYRDSVSQLNERTKLLEKEATKKKGKS